MVMMKRVVSDRMTVGFKRALGDRFFIHQVPLERGFREQQVLLDEETEQIGFLGSESHALRDVLRECRPTN